jgi:hypothetical protein
MITSGSHLPEITSKTFLEAHPGFSTQCEWKFLIVSTTLLLGYLKVSMILPSRYF